MRIVNDMSWGTLGLLTVLLGAVGCAPVGVEGSATVQGRVTNDDGFQAQSFGGEGTTTAASTVQVSAIGADGALEVLASADVAADGSYTVEVPAGQRQLIVAALDESGAAVASAILEHSGDAGDTTTCTPMTSESSLEAQVLIEMAARAQDDAELNAIDLRARITSRTAAAVREKEAAGEDAASDVRALAEAVLAAQAAEVRAYGEAGVELSQSALFEAELAASQTLSASLHAAEGSASDAYDQFHAELAAVVEEAGASAEEQARAESSAGLTFRIVVEARVDGDSSASSEVRESAVLAAAALEARTYERATLAVLAAGGASSEVKAEAEAALSELRTDLSIASSTTAAATAYQQLSVALVGEGDVQASLLGAYLGVNAATAVSVEAAVDASAEASTQLDASLTAAIDAALDASGEVDGEALAASVVAAYAAHQGAVSGAASSLAAFGDDADTAVSLLVLAEMGFRLGG